MQSTQPPKTFDYHRHNRFMICSILFFVALMVGAILTDIPAVEDFLSPYIGKMTLNNLGIVIGLLGMAVFAVAGIKGNTPVRSLSAQELHEFTEQVKNHPELSAFAQGIKTQNRLPVKEDYNRLMKFIERKEADQKLQEAQQEWETLHG